MNLFISQSLLGLRNGGVIRVHINDILEEELYWELSASVPAHHHAHIKNIVFKTKPLNYNFKYNKLFIPSKLDSEFTGGVDVIVYFKDGHHQKIVNQQSIVDGFIVTLPKEANQIIIKASRGSTLMSLDYEHTLQVYLQLLKSS